MVTLRIPGQRESRVAPHEIEGKRAGGLLTVKPVDAFRLDVTRAAASEGVTLKGLADDALVELELEGGLRLWTSVAQLREDLPAQAQRGGEAGELVMPAELPFGTPSRGIGTWVVKALRIFQVELAEGTAKAIAGKLEDQLQPGPGLYRCAYADRCELRPLAPGEVPFAGDQPALLFLHGTASSTEGSFGGLWERPQLRNAGGADCPVSAGPAGTRAGDQFCGRRCRCIAAAATCGCGRGTRQCKSGRPGSEAPTEAGCRGFSRHCRKGRSWRQAGSSPANLSSSFFAPTVRK